MTNSAIAASDECGVCGTTREDHGDKQHKFSMEGILTPLDPPPKPRQQPPVAKGEMSPEAQVLSKDPTTQVMLRMVNRMVAKGLFDGADLMYIFGNKE